MSWRTPAQLKDVLVEHIARDIKELQKLQSTLEQPTAALSNNSPPVYSLCEHLDHVLMHGLRDYRPGYWPFVRNFTRKDAVRSISDLTQVNTDVGKGRAWLFMALNEQVFGSYLRLFLENQPTVGNYYYREAFLHDTERLLLLDTLVSGLDFVTFNLTLNEGYLDYAASRPAAQLGAQSQLPTVELSFVSKLASRLPAFSDTNPVSIPAAARVKAQEELSVSFAEGSRDRNSGKEAWQSQSLGPRGQPVAPQRLPREPVPQPPQLTTISETRSYSGSGSPKVGKDEEEDEEEDRLVVHQRKTKAKRKKRKSKSKSQLDGDQSKSQLDGDQSKSQLDGDQSKSQQDGNQSSPDNKEPVLDPRRGVSSEVSKSSLDVESTPTLQMMSDMSASSKLHKSSPTSSIPEPLVTNASSQFQKPSVTTTSPKPLHDLNRTSLAIHQKPVSTNPFDDDDDDDTPFHPSSSSPSNPLPVSAPGVKPAQLVGDSGSKPVQPVNGPGTKPAQPVGGPGTKPAQPVGGPGTKPAQPVGGPGTKPAQPVRGSSGSPVERFGLGTNVLQSVGHTDPVTSAASSLSTTPLRQSSPLVLGVGDSVWTAKEEVDGGARKQPSESKEDLQKRNPRGFDEHFGDEVTENVGEPLSSRPAEHISRATMSHGYDNLVVTEADKHAADVKVDSNTKLVLSLDVLFTAEEEAHQDRLVQVNTPYSAGLYRTAFVLVTNIAVYILRRDGVDGHYCREVGILYKDFEHIVVGLDWQSLVLVYKSNTRPHEKYVLLTGSEAISKSITESIQLAVKECPGYSGSVALNKEDEVRVNAIEKELIKLGSHTSMDIIKYSLVYWEQLKGDAPKVNMTTSPTKMGHFQYRKPSPSLGSLLQQNWKTGYFKLRNTHLSLHEQDDVRAEWDLKGKSIGRGHIENKPYAISIMSGGENLLVLAASSEEEYATWMAALCEGAIGQERDSRSSQHRTCMPCALLLTTNQLHVLQEDWSNETVKLLTSCEITDVCEISVDDSLPLYCTIRYDHSGTTHHDTAQGVWMVCFSLEYELRKFIAALSHIWENEMQIGLSLMSIEDTQAKDRAHKAVELMLSSKMRSDSVTRGRSDHM